MYEYFLAHLDHIVPPPMHIVQELAQIGVDALRAQAFAVDGHVRLSQAILEYRTATNEKYNPEDDSSGSEDDEELVRKSIDAVCSLRGLCLMSHVSKKKLSARCCDCVSQMLSLLQTDSRRFCC